jgi:hypothetical protein
VPTQHLAVFLVDSSLASFPHAADHIYLYATTCLMLAAKTVEVDEKIPYITKTKIAAQSLYTTSEIRSVELNICDLFKWSLHVPTLVNFFDYFLSQGCIFSNDKLAQNSTDESAAQCLSIEKLLDLANRLENEAIVLRNKILRGTH